MITSELWTVKTTRRSLTLEYTKSSTQAAYYDAYFFYLVPDWKSMAVSGYFRSHTFSIGVQSP